MTGLLFWILFVGHTALLLFILYTWWKILRLGGNIFTKRKLVPIILLMGLTVWITFWWWKKVELIPRELNGGMQVSTMINNPFSRSEVNGL